MSKTKSQSITYYRPNSRHLQVEPPVLKQFKGRHKAGAEGEGKCITHYVYLAPIDRPPSLQIITAIKNTALNLQQWYRSQMGNGKTFSLTSDVVEVYPTDHGSGWYGANDAGGEHRGWFWANALADANRYAGAGFYQPYDDWVVYLDADPEPDQYAGGTSGGYISGVCVLPGGDVRGIQGLDPQYGICRWRGGAGHEQGHTYGLPHPEPGPNFGASIMGTGYLIFPGCVLLDTERGQLEENPFFTVQPPQPVADRTCLANNPLVRPDVKPRPHPQVASRPKK